MAYIQTSKNLKIFRFRNQKFWAENGLCHIVDEVTGEYKACSVREFLLRAKAFSEQRNREKYWDEKLEIQRMIEAMLVVCKMAKHQGDPCSEEARREMINTAKRSSRIVVPEKPKSLILPSIFVSKQKKESINKKDA